MNGWNFLICAEIEKDFVTSTSIGIQITYTRLVFYKNTLTE